MLIVYYSGTSGYTHRFVEKLGLPSTRIPIHKDEQVHVDEPFVLIVPTYAVGRRKVLPQIVQFLNNENNRNHLKGVIGTGNINFGRDYCLSAEVIANKCNVPILYRMELSGFPEDIENVKNILGETL